MGPVKFGNAERDAAVAIAPDGFSAFDQRPVVLDDAFQRFPGQVQAVEIGIAMFQRGHDPQGLGIVVEAAMILQAAVERALAGVAERRMAEVVRQRQCLREILVEAELPRQRAGDLSDFERMGQPGAIMIALMEHEHLGLVFEAAERGGVDHPVAVAPERAAGLAGRLVESRPRLRSGSQA